MGNVKGSLARLLLQKWSQALLQFVVAQACLHQQLTEACKHQTKKKASLRLKPVEAECQCYGHLGGWWELHLSRFPRMQPATNLQEQQFTFSNYRAQEWQSGEQVAATNKGISPFKHSKDRTVGVSLKFPLGGGHERSAGCKGSTQHQIFF